MNLKKKKLFMPCISPFIFGLHKYSAVAKINSGVICVGNKVVGDTAVYGQALNPVVRWSYFSMGLS